MRIRFEHLLESWVIRNQHHILHSVCCRLVRRSVNFFFAKIYLQMSGLQLFFWKPLYWTVLKHLKNYIPLRVFSSDKLLYYYILQDFRTAQLSEENKSTWLEKFFMFRSEIAMLSQLNHENIVKLIGWVCIQRFAFAMELAPRGDLNTVLGEEYEEFRRRNPERYIHDVVLSRELTYKIVTQVWICLCFCLLLLNIYFILLCPCFAHWCSFSYFMSYILKPVTIK